MEKIHPTLYTVCQRVNKYIAICTTAGYIWGKHVFFIIWPLYFPAVNHRETTLTFFSMLVWCIFSMWQQKPGMQTQSCLLTQSRRKTQKNKRMQRMPTQPTRNSYPMFLRCSFSSAASQYMDLICVKNSIWSAEIFFRTSSDDSNVWGVQMRGGGMVGVHLCWPWQQITDIHQK